MTGMKILANVATAETLLQGLHSALAELPCQPQDTERQFELVVLLRNAYLTVQSAALQVADFGPQLGSLATAVKPEYCKRD